MQQNFRFGNQVCASSGSRVFPLLKLFVPLTLLLLAACGNETKTAASSPAKKRDASQIFVDQSRQVGLDFTHVNGFTGVYFLSEIMGAGAALLDYDNDGDLDLYLVQSHALEAESPNKPNEQYHDRLLRNDLSASGPVFVDVTETAEIRAFGYGMGVAAADYDNDGFIDLYITNLGNNQLYRNQGDGTFQDVTEAAGVNDPLWSVSASWFDYDRDGLLDLYVGNFTDFNYINNRQCFGANRDYCSPLSYGAALDTLFKNLGDGTFANVSRQAGIHKDTGRALGVIAADYDNDGWQDIYVANDSSANQLWINQKDGTFSETAMLAGAAVSQSGMPEASMGVDAGDFDNDGDEDLFMTHLGNQTNTIYVNDGKGWFEDASNPTGLGSPSLPYTGFGTAWFDYDNDSFLDLFIANGAVKRPEQVDPSQGMKPYRQANQLFHNKGDGTFRELTSQELAVLVEEEVSRGVALGDLDNDGDLDFILTNNAGPARYLENQAGSDQPWAGFRLINRQGSDALGAKIHLVFSDGSSIWRRCRTDGSYACSNDPRVLIGLANPLKTKKFKSLEVYWANGEIEAFGLPKKNQYTLLWQGRGTVIE